jgi:hypothetical protein
VTKIVSVFVFVPSFAWQMYLVETRGAAAGVAVVSVNPAGIELHKYVYVPDPPVALAFNRVESPRQIVPGDAVIVSSNIFAKVKEAILVFQLLEEVVEKYSWVYQKLLDVSTVMEL